MQPRAQRSELHARKQRGGNICTAQYNGFIKRRETERRGIGIAIRSLCSQFCTFAEYLYIFIYYAIDIIYLPEAVGIITSTLLLRIKGEIARCVSPSVEYEMWTVEVREVVRSIRKLLNTVLYR